MIKRIIKKKNVIIKDLDKNIRIGNKKGVLIIELENKKDMIVDLKSGNDLSNRNIEIKETPFTKTKEIFINILYNEKLLKKLMK